MHDLCSILLATFDGYTIRESLFQKPLLEKIFTPCKVSYCIVGRDTSGHHTFKSTDPSPVVIAAHGDVVACQGQSPKWGL